MLVEYTVALVEYTRLYKPFRKANDYLQDLLREQEDGVKQRESDEKVQLQENEKVMDQDIVWSVKFQSWAISRIQIVLGNGGAIFMLFCKTMSFFVSNALPKFVWLPKALNRCSHCFCAFAASHKLMMIIITTIIMILSNNKNFIYNSFDIYREIEK